MERMGGEWEACGPTTSQILGPPGYSITLYEKYRTLRHCLSQNIYVNEKFANKRMCITRRYRPKILDLY